MNGGPRLKPVHFEFTDPAAHTICIGLVVDGKWMPAPLAREMVANPFGGRSPVLRPSLKHLTSSLRRAPRTINVGIGWWF